MKLCKKKKVGEIALQRQREKREEEKDGERTGAEVRA